MSVRQGVGGVDLVRGIRVRRLDLTGYGGKGGCGCGRDTASGRHIATLAGAVLTEGSIGRDGLVDGAGIVDWVGHHGMLAIGMGRTPSWKDRSVCISVNVLQLLLSCIQCIA